MLLNGWGKINSLSLLHPCASSVNTLGVFVLPWCSECGSVENELGRTSVPDRAFQDCWHRAASKSHWPGHRDAGKWHKHGTGVALATLTFTAQLPMMSCINFTEEGSWHLSGSGIHHRHCLICVGSVFNGWHRKSRKSLEAIQVLLVLLLQH